MFFFQLDPAQTKAGTWAATFVRIGVLYPPAN